jgi:transcriptional regulator with XRE-family HTH domain
VDFKDQLRAARRRAGLTQEQLGEALGVSRVTISNWESGTNMPEGARVREIAAAVKSTVSELFGEIAARHIASEPEAIYVGKPVPTEPTNNWPPVVGTAQLGTNGYWLELDYPTGHGDGFVKYPSRDPNAYAVRCKGDSMRPRIKPGEFAVLEPNHPYAPGDEVLIKDKGGRVMIKVFNFARNGSIEVGSINEDHKNITLEMADIECIHYVVAICKAAMYYKDIA